MSTYVMADIHGCYNELQMMIRKIRLSKTDKLIIAGDYIDRGWQNFEMLRWMETAPDNIFLLKGNHDVEFVSYVALIEDVFAQSKLDMSKPDDLKLACGLIKQIETAEFDVYGTIEKLIETNRITALDLSRWADVIREMPFYYEMQLNNRRCIIVHAGYVEDLACITPEEEFDTLEDFFLYARDDAFVCGGIPHGMIVAGHTPTIIEEELSYNEGNVCYFYDEEQDCIFYNIDCGCSYREKCRDAKLACLRLEDEMIFYI